MWQLPRPPRAARGPATAARRAARRRPAAAAAAAWPPSRPPPSRPPPSRGAARLARRSARRPAARVGRRRRRRARASSSSSSWRPTAAGSTSRRASCWPFVGSTALLGRGLYLHEQPGPDAGRAGRGRDRDRRALRHARRRDQLYDLIDPAFGLVFAGLVGATATAIAVRWSEPVVAGIGLVGALLAPALVDAGTDSASLAFMAIALVSTVGVLLWQRWSWLAVAAFAVSAPQLAVWLHGEHDDSSRSRSRVLAAFWLLYAAAAVGYELREPDDEAADLLREPPARQRGAAGRRRLGDAGQHGSRRVGHGLGRRRCRAAHRRRCACVRRAHEPRDRGADRRGRDGARGVGPGSRARRSGARRRLGGRGAGARLGGPAARRPARLRRRARVLRPRGSPYGRLRGAARSAALSAPTTSPPRPSRSRSSARLPRD